MSYDSPQMLVSAALVASAVRRMQDEAVFGVRHDVLRDFSRYRNRWRRRSINTVALAVVGICGFLVAHSVVEERRHARVAVATVPAESRPSDHIEPARGSVR